jgi:hypothetical protein
MHVDQESRVAWPDAVDDIIGGDQAVAFAYATPASGVVLLPLTNVALRDRAAGTVSPVSSSVGMWKKLQRIRRNPRIAVGYHTRRHGFSDGPEYVLLQGRAELTPIEDRDWVERHLENWERFSGPRRVGPIGERWLEAYHWRVGLNIDVERLVVWPDLGCRDEPAVYGQRLPEDAPEPQGRPRNGTAPRINHPRAARRARRLPNVLLGWVGADGFPVVVPVGVAGCEERGFVLDLPEGVPAPLGGRRAGFLAHSFARYTFGQNQRRHTGWLEVGPDRRAIYAPHTNSGYHLPKSRLLYRISSGFLTSRGLRQAKRAGFIES